MSDAAESNADPWAQACAEDLAAERARRRAAGCDDTSREAVESLRDVLGRLAGEAGRLNPAAGLAARQATSALDPLLERHRDTVSHLARAGTEFAAACRAALDPDSAKPGGAKSGSVDDHTSSPAGSDVGTAPASDTGADCGGGALGTDTDTSTSADPEVRARPADGSSPDGGPPAAAGGTAPHTTVEEGAEEPGDAHSGDGPPTPGVGPGEEPGRPRPWEPGA